jgi:hypothetical protein
MTFRKKCFVLFIAALIAMFSLTTYATTTTIDDEDAGWSTTGSWTQWDQNGGIGGDMYYDEAGTGTEKATWNFGTLNGQYLVEIHYTAQPNRATDSPFVVKNHTSVVQLPTVALAVSGVSDNVDDDGGANANATTVLIDQEKVSAGTEPGTDTDSGWISIGTYTFGGVSNALVILTDDADEYVIADAVRVTSISPAAEPIVPIRINGGGVVVNNGAIIIR